MKILYLHQYFATPESNCGTRSYEMARRLVCAGHQVTLVTTSAFVPHFKLEGAGWHRRELEGIALEILNLPYSNRVPFHRRVLLFFAFALRAMMRVARLKADVVFATSTPLTIALPGIFASRFHRVPLVFEVRDLWPELPIAVGAIRNPLAIWLARWLERRAYGNSAQVVALSPGMAEGVAATGYDRSRISVIPNSCDLELFRPNPLAGAAFRQAHAWLGQRPLVIYAGTLGLINGVSYLAELAAAVKKLDAEVRFAVFGSGMERDKIEQRARALRVLDDNFYLLPPLAKTEITGVFAAATVSTSLFLPMEPMWNNSANKFFDTLASGTPVAINYYGWQAELLERSDAGMVLSPHDIDQAAATLVSRLRDEAWLAQAGAAARALACEQFSRDRLAGQLEQVLMKACSC